MLVRVKRHAHCGDAGDAVFGKDAVEFAASGFKANDQALHRLAFAHLGWDSFQSTRQVIRH